MTTWTMNQVHAVARMWVEGWISEELATNPDARAAVHHQHAKQLTHEARVHAVEIHPDDVQILIGERERTTFTRKTRAWWQPKTDELELLGGLRDGEVYQFPGARRGDPFRTPRPIPVAALIAAPDSPIDVMQIDTWERHGWNEQARRWVYTPGR